MTTRPLVFAIPLIAVSTLAFSQQQPAPARPTSAATRPTTTSGRGVDANATLNRMLRPTTPVAKPLQPLPADTPIVDATSGGGAVAPAAPAVKLVREGTYVVDRVGRLRKSEDGQHQEFAFDADGNAMQDPPMIILPNLALMQMENATQSNRDRKFRVTGMVTEYRGRNCILLDKAVPVAEPLRPQP